MTIPLVKTGGWTDGETLTPLQASTLQNYLIRAVDGVNGGSFSPGTTITISGSGLTMGGTSNLLLASRDIVRQQPLNAAPYSTAQWLQRPNGTWRNLLTTTLLPIRLHDLPHGNVLKYVSVRYTGAAGHASDPVQLAMPILNVYSVDNSDTATLLGTKTDTDTVRAVYEAYHDITTAALGHTIDTVNNRYLAVLTAEAAGVDPYVANAEVCQCSTTCTMTTMTEY